ncbi:MAG: T9SS type A sorting domain-containing protein [Bacteroidota bacterium]
MKKIYTLITGSLLIAASATQLNAQCAGGRYHDFIFPGATVTSNVTYGSNAQFNNVALTLKLDVYEPQGDTDTLRPLIIFAHGGSFVGGSKSSADMAKICTDFTKLGYVAASIDYRLYMTDLPFPGPDSNDAGAAVMRAVQDGRAAVRFFRKNFSENGNTYGIDTSKIYFGGASAGGLIALHLAYMDEQSEFPTYIDTTGTTVGSKTGQKGLHGGIEGLSGNQGYSSRVKGIINLSGAISDTAWIHTGDVPLLSTHATGDGTVPYGTALIYLQPPNTYPIQTIDGSATVAEKANEVGLVNCFKTYYLNSHVPETNIVVYDTTLCLMRNFLEHLTCGTPLNCNYTSKVTGINDLSFNDVRINAYPNPANNSLTIDLTAFKGKNVNIELYDALGRKVKSFTNIKTEQYIIARDNTMPTGIYSINIISEGKIYSKKVMFE